jgi:preprotein translocase subunit SecG
MEIIVGIVVAFFVPVCVLLTISILLQDSKGEGLSGSAFGASEMQSLLGGQGAATFLSKLTTYVAIAFMIIALFLMRFYGGGDSGTLTPLQMESEQTQVSTGDDEADNVSDEGVTSQTEGADETAAESTNSDSDDVETAPSSE